MDNAGNVVVLTVFAVSIVIVIVIVGYILAWKSNQTALRKVGSLMVATVAGCAGLVMSVWLIGAVMPFPPPDGGTIWGPIIALLVLSPLPLGAFFLCARFLRRALTKEKTTTEVATGY